MRKIFLTLAGLPRETSDYFVKILPKKPAEIKVCFIPTAANPEVDKSFVQKSLDELRDVGINNVTEVDLDKENKNSLYEKLSSYDVIYVNGGNTFYLLDRVRKSGFDEIITRLLDDEKIYMGVSAGSIIAGPNIESAGWKWLGIVDKNIVGLKNLQGLNLVSFETSPHFVENDRKTLEENSKNVNYPIIAINDEQAVLCIGDDYKIVGEGEKLIYNNSLKI